MLIFTNLKSFNLHKHRSDLNIFASLSHQWNLENILSKIIIFFKFLLLQITSRLLHFYDSLSYYVTTTPILGGSPHLLDLKYLLDSNEVFFRIKRSTQLKMLMIQIFTPTTEFLYKELMECYFHILKIRRKSNK